MSAKKPTPVKAANIASFFAPKSVAAGAADAPALAAKKVSDDARASVKPSGKLDFATVDPPPAAPEPASEALDAATNPREPLATVADYNGGAPRASSRRDSDLTGTVAGSNQQSPAASVGDAYHTPAVGLRAARAAESDMNSPIVDADAGAQPIDSRAEAPSAAPKSSAAIGASAVKSAADYAAAARDLEAKANEALAAIRDDAKLEAILADAKKPKPTTEPGRLMRRAENAKARAEAEARKEEERAAKAAAKEEEKRKKEAEKAAKEAAKEEEKRKKEAEKAAKEAAKEAEKAAKEEEKRKKEAEKAAAAAEKEAAAAAEKAAKEAAAAARAEREAALLPDLVRYLLENPKTNKETATNAFCESRSVPEFELAKTSIRAKIGDVAEARKPGDRRWEIKPEALAAAGLTAEQAEAMRPELELTEEEKARERKRAEAAEKEAARKAEEAKAAARKAKQANAFKGFFAAAPKKPAVPEPAVTAPPAPAALDAAREEALVAAVASDDVDAAAAETRRRDMLASWRSARRGVASAAAANDRSGRWGQRRAPKRARADGASSSADAALRAAMEASVAESGAAPQPKRRKLISVDCSSEYEDKSSYRFGFQLGVDQLDGPHELRKTFPVPGGRPAYWGSGAPPGRPGPRSAAVTGRRPFARDPETEYEVDGALFDSGDEWEEEEEGENLDDSDADGEDEDDRADRGEDEDDKEGFVVPDGYLSEEENAKGDDEILADADDADDADDDAEDGVGLGLELERGVGLAPAAADDARAKRDRARAELTRWMDRARRQNRPLVIAAFARDADGAAEGENAAAGSTGAQLLHALAPVRFRAPAVAPGASAPPAIRMFRARRDGAEVASGAGSKAATADAGGASKRRRLCDFPEEMTRPLVEFLLVAAPKMNKETATAAFAESRSDDATELAKTAVRAKIGDVAELNVNDRRWEIKPEALAAAGLTAEQAEAMRPELELTEEEKARAAKKAEKEAEKEARRKDAEEKKRARDAAKAEKEAAKAAKAAAKATKAAGIAQALLKASGGGAAAGAAAGAVAGAASNVASNVARSPPATSPIKSLFDRAAAKATPPAKPEETATAMDVDGEAPAV